MVSFLFLICGASCAFYVHGSDDACFWFKGIQKIFGGGEKYSQIVEKYWFSTPARLNEPPTKEAVAPRGTQVARIPLQRLSRCAGAYAAPRRLAGDQRRDDGGRETGAGLVTP
jgi:hypothetical protein